jgi:predicted RNase H-like nuclease (RuvC/YqgF family)
MMRILSSLIIYLFLVTHVYAVDICLPEEQAKQVIVELKQKRVLEQEIKEYEALIENLKKQNELLQEQNRLLKEQIEIYKNQVSLYQTALKECEKQKGCGFFEKVKITSFGAILGAIVTTVLFLK